MVSGLRWARAGAVGVLIMLVGACGSGGQPGGPARGTPGPAPAAASTPGEAKAYAAGCPAPAVVDAALAVHAGAPVRHTAGGDMHGYVCTYSVAEPWPVVIGFF